MKPLNPKIAILLLPFLLLLFFFLFALWPRSGESAGLSSVLQAQQAVVQVKAISGTVQRTNPKPVLTPDGNLATVNTVRPMFFERSGGGIILTESGLIVTNAHTIQNASKILIILADRTRASASLKKWIPENDIALLQIESETPLHPVVLSNSDQIALRSEVFSIGHSQFLKNTVSGGTVKGLGVSRRNRPTQPIIVGLIEVSFNAYQGDSGSPILDPNGHLLGLIVGGHKGTRTSFAVPSNTIAEHAREFFTKV